MDVLIKKYIARLNYDFPEEDKMYADLRDFLTEGLLNANKGAELSALRDELYDAIPTGEVNAFDLIKVIKQHIGKLDKVIESAPIVCEYNEEKFKDFCLGYAKNHGKDYNEIYCISASAIQWLKLQQKQKEEKVEGKNNPLLQLMHDTMSPVNTIKGAVDLLKGDTLSAEERNRLLDGIKERADKLNEALDAYYTTLKQ